jgi:hypothetical protein
MLHLLLIIYVKEQKMIEMIEEKAGERAFTWVIEPFS